MSNNNIGSQAKELVLLFYDKTKLKYTNKNIMVAVKNAKTLLEAGYTFDEIKDTINYCVTNPPAKGIYSFGFIVHEINKVTTMLKAQNKKVVVDDVAMSSSMLSNYGIQEVSNKDKIKSSKEFGKINIFDK